MDRIGSRAHGLIAFALGDELDDAAMVGTKLGVRYAVRWDRGRSIAGLEHVVVIVDVPAYSPDLVNLKDVVEGRGLLGRSAKSLGSVTGGFIIDDGLPEACEQVFDFSGSDFPCPA